MHLDYAGIQVSNLQRSLRFYGRGLGLLEIRRGRTETGGSWILLEDQVSRQRLALNWDPENARSAARRQDAALEHFTVRTEDVKALATRLRDAGASPADQRSVAGTGESVLLRDPDGILIEVLPEPQQLLATPPA